MSPIFLAILKFCTDQGAVIEITARFNWRSYELLAATFIPITQSIKWPTIFNGIFWWMFFVFISAGAIIGIVVGVFGFILIVCISDKCRRKCRKKWFTGASTNPYLKKGIKILWIPGYLVIRLHVHVVTTQRSSGQSNNGIKRFIQSVNLALGSNDRRAQWRFFVCFQNFCNL